MAAKAHRLVAFLLILYSKPRGVTCSASGFANSLWAVLSAKSFQFYFHHKGVGVMLKMNEYVFFLLLSFVFLDFFVVKLAFIFLIHYFCKIILQEI